MEDEKARRQIMKLTARSLAMRDIVIRLLAYEARRASNPEELFQELMESADVSADEIPADKKGSPGGGEAVRIEVRKIVSFARKML